MRSRLSALEQPSTLRADAADDTPDDVTGLLLNRRHLLRRGLQASAATLAAAALLRSDRHAVEASHSTTDIDADQISAHYVEGVSEDNYIGVMGTTNSDFYSGVWGINAGEGPAVYGGSLSNTATGIGVEGQGPIGVKGEGTVGVKGASIVDGGFGVTGDGTVGVKGASTSPVETLGGIGLWGDGPTGVYGTSVSTGFAAVQGEHSADGYGLYGVSSASTRAGVKGINTAGDAVRGDGKVGVRGVSLSGNGVFGEGGSGYGGQFKGNRAQLRLTPTTRTGRPTTGTHQIGELYLDKLGALFMCTVAGTPGTWRKVTTTAA